MDIPKSCEKWAEMMAIGKDDEAQILMKLEHEKCIDDNTTNEFFKRLADKGEPSQPEEAKRMALDVIQEDPDTFTCRGQEVPSNVFLNLFRLEDLKALRWRVPDCLKRLGIVDEELIRGLPEEELASVTDEYDDIVSLGNPFDIVLATDYDIVKNELTDLSTLVDRLGLDNLVNEKRCVVCVYNRSKIGVVVFLPRSFDGLSYNQFELVDDCDAESGKTKPLSTHEQGLPEGVHKGCDVIPEQWKLGLIK